MERRHKILVGGGILFLFCTACLWDDIYGAAPPPEPKADAGGFSGTPDSGSFAADAQGPAADAAAPADAGACASVNGTWTITGDCPMAKSCTFSQTGCMAAVDCHIGISATATIVDRMVHIDAGPGTCDLVLNGAGNSMTGMCSDFIGTNSCTLTATR